MTVPTESARVRLDALTAPDGAGGLAFQPGPRRDRAHRVDRRHTAIVISALVHFLLIVVLAVDWAPPSEPAAQTKLEPDRVWIDGPVLGRTHAGGSDVAAGPPSPEPLQTPAEELLAPPSPREPQPQRRIAPDPVPSNIPIPLGSSAIAPIELAGGGPSSPAQGSGEAPAQVTGAQGLAAGRGAGERIGFGGGWEDNYGRRLVGVIKREAEGEDLGRRPLRLTKELVVLLEIDETGKLCRQHNGHRIHVLNSAVNDTAHDNLLAAIERAAADFPPFPVADAHGHFTLEVHFRLGPDGLEL